MKSSPSAPAAPDPQQSAQAQTGSNIATAIANARLNRVNQTTPWGSISYTEGPTDANGVPTYSSSIQLSPQQQALFNAQQQQSLQRQGLASGFLNNVSTKPLDLSSLGGLYDRYGDGYNHPQQPQAQSPQYSQPNPNTGMSNADMMAALQQYLQSQGGSISGGTNPIAAAVRNTPPATPAQTTTPATQAPGVQQGNPNGSDPFGTAGPTYITPGSNSGDSWQEPTVHDQYVNVNGQQMIRVGHLPQGSTDYFRDPSKVQYDPRYGFVTTPDNLTGGSPDTTMGKIIPAGIALGAGAVLAPYLAAQFGAGAASGADAAVPAATDAAVAAPAPVADASVAASQGAPVTDLSVAHQSPNLFQQAFQNVTSGRGLFGNRVANAATGPLLARIIRGMSAQGGK